MNYFDKKDQEFLNKLKEARKPSNYITVEIKYNNEIIERKEISVNQYSIDIISKLKLWNLLTEFIKNIIQELKNKSSENKSVDEITKKINTTKPEKDIKSKQMNDMWAEFEKNKNKNL